MILWAKVRNQEAEDLDKHDWLCMPYNLCSLYKDTTEMTAKKRCKPAGIKKN